MAYSVPCHNRCVWKIILSHTNMNIHMNVWKLLSNITDKYNRLSEYTSCLRLLSVLLNLQSIYTVCLLFIDDCWPALVALWSNTPSNAHGA